MGLCTAGEVTWRGKWAGVPEDTSYISILGGLYTNFNVFQIFEGGAFIANFA